MKNSLTLLTFLTGILLFSACASTPPPAASSSGITLVQLLQCMPPKDTTQAHLVYSSMVALGPDAVLALCDSLGRTGTETRTRAQYALQGLALYVTGKGRERDRAILVAALGKALDAQRAPEVASFILGRLQIAGGIESARIIGRFLSDERLCEPAAQALMAIRDGAETQFIAALPPSRGNARVTITQCLGELRSRGAVDLLVAESSSDEMRLRMASLYALANIGERRAGDILTHALAASSPFERDEVASYYLLYARRQAESGNTAEALRIGDALLRGNSPASEDQVRAEALDLLVRVKGDGAIGDVTGAFRDSSRALRGAALRLASRLPGRPATLRYVAALSESAHRGEILSMLGERGDTSAYPAVASLMNDVDPGVRATAIDAAVRLKREGSIPDLLGVLDRSTDARDVAAVGGALRRLSSARVTPVAVASLPHVTEPACVMLLDYFARTKEAPAGPIFDLAKSNDMPVHLSELKAIGSVGTADDAGRLTALFLNEESESGRATAGKSLVELCSRISDRENRTDALLAAYGAATPDQREGLLRVMGHIGGQKALALASAESRSKDRDMRDAAVRALADWPTMDAFDTLLVISKSKETLNLRVIALRGAVRLVEDSGLPAATAVRYCERALEAAQRPEEKRLILGALSHLRTVESLRDVIPYIGNDSLGMDAAMAAASIASGPYAAETGIAPAGVARSFIESMVPGRYRSSLAHNFDVAAGMNEPPEGFSALFNGRNLDGWKGLVENPLLRAKMTPEQLARAQARADSVMRAHWSVHDGILLFDGKGENICTARDYADFEMMVDWKIEKNGDSGIYLRGSPQVQIWDPSQWPEGSGGLYNNEKHQSKPLVRADNPVGEWNTFRIRMIGERVTVWLNNVLVVDSVVLENYWDRSIPIFRSGQIELQSHSSPLYFRNIYIREIPSQGPLFSGSLFNGTDLTGWTIVNGKPGSWGVDQGLLYTTGEGGGWLSTLREYGNYDLDLDFRLSDGGNSGVFLRTPREGDPAYVGMEIQILDDYAPVYATLHEWQFCGSIYGVQAPSVRASKKAHEWQHYHIVARGPHVSVTLNDRLIVDADLIAHMDKESTHPGIKRRSGFIGLQCHTGRVEFRNITLKEIAWNEENEKH